MGEKEAWATHGERVDQGCMNEGKIRIERIFHAGDSLGDEEK